MKETTYKSPLYIQLREVLRTKIEDGEYLPGTQIPSENQLSEMYGISRLSVRSALQALVEEGVLTSIQGKGVFVTGNKFIGNLDTFGGYTHKRIVKGTEESIRIISKVRRQAGSYYSILLNILEETEIWFISSLTLVDGKPNSLEEAYIPCDIVPNLDEVDLSVFSKYDMFCWNKHKPNVGEQTLKITKVDKVRANYLGIKPDKPILKFSYLIKESGGRVIEYSRNFVISDNAEFVVEFRNDEE